VPAVPSCLLEPIWVEFRALLGAERPPFDPGHPLGCHRRRVSDRVVFEHMVAALVHGSGYERIATAGCSDRTIRRLKDGAGRASGSRCMPWRWPPTTRSPAWSWPMWRWMGA
jgi:hypothetical protein